MATVGRFTARVDQGPVVTGVPAIEQRTRATPEQVWSVLADGWLYPSWVVGASRARHVEPGWPEVGQCIHHSFGVWPLVLDDVTEVVESQPHRRLTMRAKGWPAGEALVTVTLESEPTGSLLRLAEDASSGPGLLVPRVVRQAVITPRNTESLKRLVFLAEGRAHAAL